MPFRIQKAAIIVLTMQLEDLLANTAQQFAADPSVIDPCGFAAIDTIDAPNDQLARIFKTCLVEEIGDRMIQRQIKHGDHFARTSPAAHQIRTSTPSQSQPQSIEQNRFARPGFPRQDIEPRTKFQMQLINNENVTNI